MKKIYFLFSFLIISNIIFSQECGIVYISPSGASSGITGTRANPANLSYGLTLFSTTNNRLWLSTGSYAIALPIQLQDSMIIEGGFNVTTWDKSNTTESIINKDNSNVIPSPANALVAIAGSNKTNFRLQDITINVVDAPSPQGSVYGVYLSGCSNYNIVRTKITTGKGGNGLLGTIGSTGSVGGNGSTGNPGNPNELVQPGGAGGIGASGNNGGNGGPSGKWNGSSPPGSTGLPSVCGGVGGNSGAGPSCGFFSCGSCSGASPGQNGTGGTSGIAGANGANGSVGTISLGYFVPGLAGSNGAKGTDGCGGGGGGGGGGDQQSGPDGVGGSGGGGGAGGSGGTGGTGGTGGGSSYAIFLWLNGTGGNIVDCLLQPGLAGVGGAGGVGGVGGAGGAGGAGGVGDCPQENGGAGGTGGAGGVGGTGGTGASGESIAVKLASGFAVTQLGITGIPGNPPIITTNFRGCVNSEVTYSGSVNSTWNFGAGATPSTANGTGPFSVIYNTLGRKTINYNGTNFTDYVDIFSNTISLSSITPSNGTVSLGCPNNFSTSSTGSYYQWIFAGPTNIDTIEGTSMQTATGIIYGAPGTYTIYLWTTTACCGRVLDSTTININSSTLNVNLTATPDTICQGDTIIFNASTGFNSYQFFVNSTSVQNNSANTYTSSLINQGDSVIVVAFDGSCFSNPSAIIYPTVNPIPIDTLTTTDADSAICQGDVITFNASPNTYANYEFFDGTNSLQNGSSSSLTTSNLTPGSIITVVSFNGGCQGSASNAIPITVNLLPIVSLSSSDPDSTICVGDSLTITATSGYSNYEFFVNSTSVQNNSSNSYVATSLNNGDSITCIATSSAGCLGNISQAITITVILIPTVSLTAFPDTVCEGELIAFTATPAGYSNYTFFDGVTFIQSTANNIYTDTLSVGNHALTVVANNFGCISSPSNTVNVVVNPNPPIKAGNDFSMCFTDSAHTLTGMSPTGGTWSGTGITNSIGNFSSIIAGVGQFNLVYQYTNSGGCIKYDTVVATVNPIPNVNAGSNVNLCNGDSTLLSASGGVSYSWIPTIGLSNSNISNPMLTIQDTTLTYQVIATDINGCTGTDSIQVISSSIFVSAGPDVTIDYGLQNPLAGSGTNVSSYSWSPSDGLDCFTCQTPIASPTENTTYVLMGTNSNGCVAYDTVLVDVIINNEIFVPSGFSPNGDGQNDVLFVRASAIRTLYFVIYDKWGQKVFETKDIKNGWDGTIHGKKAESGVYMYYLNAIIVNNNSKELKGDITLVR